MEARGAAYVRRGLLFAGLVVACTAVAGGYLAWKIAAGESAASTTVSPTAPAALTGAHRIVFQNVERENGYAQVSSIPAANPRAERLLSGLVCERVHYSGGRGICLMPRRNVLRFSYDARLLDAQLRESARVSLPGINNRARVSPDGRFAAATGFVSGDSYADQSFSTRTFLLDVERGEKIANLEDFAVYRDGERIRSVDMNFWGVTFGTGGRFYATLQTRGRRYLIRGSVAQQRAEVIHEGVECPSLSPDGSKIAFKKRTGQSSWRLTVLDLSTFVETSLAETRSVDDQAEWLNEEEVLYGLNAAVWSVRADGTGKPRVLIADALSPAVLRPAPARYLGK